jgi:catechol 2,3-dioxygenase-like lactoylglutathione lyase family enzyme
MLADAPVTATIAVKDLNAAKQFYGGTLGLKQTDETPAGVTYGTGASALLVYPSVSSSGTNQATYAFWKVEDIEAVVAELKSKGVTFEQYDNIPGSTRDGEIHTMGSAKGAWFKDPEGNILSLSNM